MLYEDYSITPGKEDNWSAQTLCMNAQNPGMIFLAPWICGKDCMKGARAINPLLGPDGTFQLVPLQNPMYLFLHLRPCTKTKHHATIEYSDIM